MGRNKRRVRRDGGFLAKQDTPAKATKTGQKIRRLQLRNVYEALPEEKLVSPAEPDGPVTINIQPVNNKTVLVVRSDARDEIQPDLFSSITVKKKPACPPVVQMISELGPFKTHNEIVPTVKEQDGRKMAAMPESEITFSVESDTTFNLDDDDDDDDKEDCYASSNTLPSPEIFRGETDVEPETSCIKARHKGLHPIISNSTLLDMSCAQSIYMHQPPDMSAINNASSVLAEKCEISNNTRPEGKRKKISFKSDDDIHFKTPAKLTRKKSFLCKKVVFKSPITTEYPHLEAKHAPATKCTTDPVQTLSPADQVKPGETASIPGEMSSEDGTLLSGAKLKRSVKGGSEKAKFFDFVSDADKNMFFRRARERSVKLKSAPLFPLSAAKHAVNSVW